MTWPQRRTSAEEWRAQREADRAARKRGGWDYRDVEVRPGGLLVGNVFVGEPGDASPFGALFGRELEASDEITADGLYEVSSICRRIGVSAHARLFECECARYFVAHWQAKRCMACRKAKARALMREFTAARSAKRAQARAARAPRACATCGEPMTVVRSTKRFCSDGCRNAARP
jgi:hypothetical protein